VREDAGKTATRWMALIHYAGYLYATRHVTYLANCE
jgi:hypothetical protein